LKLLGGSLTIADIISKYKCKLSVKELSEYYNENSIIINNWEEIFKQLLNKKDITFMTKQFKRTTNNLKKSVGLEDTERFNQKANTISLNVMFKTITHNKSSEINNTYYTKKSIEETTIYKI